MAKKITYLFFGLTCWISAPAQQLDTLIQLSTVEVRENRLQSFSTGTKNEVVDSALSKLSASPNLAEILTDNSTVYIKNYGPGRLATTALRGGAAQHTAILWNGIQLQNPMLGQIDLSLIPVLFMDEVNISYGGSSALWGSGALGGSIHLSNLPQFEKDWQGQWRGTFGNFGQLNNELELGYSSDKFSTSTRAFYQKSENDFPFQTDTGTEKKLDHSKLENGGFLQSLSFRPGIRHQVSAQFWYQHTNRQIPPLRNQSLSVATQQEKANRSNFHWKYKGNKFVWDTRLAYFDEQLIYTDSIADIFSDSKTKSIIAESETSHYLSAKHQLNAGLNYTRYRAASTAYIAPQNQNRLAAFFSYRYRSENQNLSYTLNFRQELVDGSWIPFTPSAGMEWQFHPDWKLQSTIARNFRLPGLNDLYFNPGGNPELKPEQGWSEDIGLTFQRNFRHHYFKVNATLFNRNINNWIIWLPRGNIWSPENVQEVWSRGLESSFQWTLTRKKWQLMTRLNYDYVRSTNQKAKSLNDASLGKQLIYVPVHKINGNLHLKYKSWSLAWWQAYTDAVFLLADNSESLPGYWLSHFSLGRHLKFQALKVNLNIKINNLFDKDYEVVAGRPMPGRHYALSLNLQFK